MFEEQEERRLIEETPPPVYATGADTGTKKKRITKDDDEAYARELQKKENKLEEERKKSEKSKKKTNGTQSQKVGNANPNAVPEDDIESKITQIDILGILFSILSIPASIIVIILGIVVIVGVILLYVFFTPMFFLVADIAVPFAIVSAFFVILLPATLLILAMITSYMVIQKFDNEQDGETADVVVAKQKPPAKTKEKAENTSPVKTKEHPLEVKVKVPVKIEIDKDALKKSIKEFLKDTGVDENCVHIPKDASVELLQILRKNAIAIIKSIDCLKDGDKKEFETQRSYVQGKLDKINESFKDKPEEKVKLFEKQHSDNPVEVKVVEPFKNEEGEKKDSNAKKTHPFMETYNERIKSTDINELMQLQKDANDLAGGEDGEPMQFALERIEAISQRIEEINAQNPTVIEEGEEEGEEDREEDNPGVEEKNPPSEQMVVIQGIIKNFRNDCGNHMLTDDVTLLEKLRKNANFIVSSIGKLEENEQTVLNNDFVYASNKIIEIDKAIETKTEELIGIIKQDIKVFFEFSPDTDIELKDDEVVLGCDESDNHLVLWCFLQRANKIITTFNQLNAQGKEHLSVALKTGPHSIAQVINCKIKILTKFKNNGEIRNQLSVKKKTLLEKELEIIKPLEEEVKKIKVVAKKHTKCDEDEVCLEPLQTHGGKSRKGFFSVFSIFKKKEHLKYEKKENDPKSAEIRETEKGDGLKGGAVPTTTEVQVETHNPVVV